MFDSDMPETANEACKSKVVEYYKKLPRHKNHDSIS